MDYVEKSLEVPEIAFSYQTILYRWISLARNKEIYLKNNHEMHLFSSEKIQLR